MTDFESILEKARERQGGSSELERLLPNHKSHAELTAMADAYYLSNMSRRIFRAGLKHSMVDAKWPAFEKAFMEFNIQKVRLMSDEDLELRMQDKRIIRHWGKIKSVRANAEAMEDLNQEYSNMGEYLALWPSENLIGLWDDLKKRFTQLGGMSGPYFLRMVERDTFVITKDVLKALHHWQTFRAKGMQKKTNFKSNDTLMNGKMNHKNPTAISAVFWLYRSSSIKGVK